MARTPATFKQADLVRAVKAALACGLDVVRTEIAADGRIVLVHHTEQKKAPEAEYEKWRARKNACAA